MSDPIAPPARLASLDAFRGLTIAAMILVNNPGDWLCAYWPLLHVKWHGWTPTDLSPSRGASSSVRPWFVFAEYGRQLRESEMRKVFPMLPPSAISGSTE